MSWKETKVFDDRKDFITGYHCYGYTMTELCRAFGVSRKTGYKFLRRYEAEGDDGLHDKSSAPRHHPNETSSHIREMIIEAKLSHPTWGPRKLVKWLSGKHPQTDFPASSTAGGILKRNGMVKSKKKRNRHNAQGTPFSEVASPNDLWCADFKGWFRVKDGKRCDPLTVTDAHSRFLLTCYGVRNTKTQPVKEQFARTFREYGMPKAIRTDNGPPFSSRGLAGLSRLSVWWLRLGIIPERIEPGHPEQNGRHERMHLTLKLDTAIPPKKDIREQQQTFDHFREEYNHERPHEALNDKKPSDVYSSSERIYPRRLREFEYPKHYDSRKVTDSGIFNWRGSVMKLSTALAGERVGLEQTTEDHWVVHLGSVEIALLSESHRHVLPYAVIQETK